MSLLFSSSSLASLSLATSSVRMGRRDRRDAFEPSDERAAGEEVEERQESDEMLITEFGEADDACGDSRDEPGACGDPLDSRDPAARSGEDGRLLAPPGSAAEMLKNQSPDSDSSQTPAAAPPPLSRGPADGELLVRCAPPPAARTGSVSSSSSSDSSSSPTGSSSSSSSGKSSTVHFPTPAAAGTENRHSWTPGSRNGGTTATWDGIEIV